MERRRKGSMGRGVREKEQWGGKVFADAQLVTELS